MIRTKSLFYLSLLAMVLAIPMLASAADQVFKVPFSFSFDFTQACSYGDLQVTVAFTGVDIHHLDANGNLINDNAHEVVTTTLVNPLNGKVASGSGTENDTFKWVDGQETQQITRGIPMLVTVPGVGQFRLAGRIIYDFSNGFAITFQTPKVTFTPEFSDALCAALE